MTASASAWHDSPAPVSDCYPLHGPRHSFRHLRFLTPQPSPGCYVHISFVHSRVVTLVHRPLAVLVIRNEDDLTQVDLGSVLSHSMVMVVTVTATTTAGKALDAAQLDVVVEAAEHILKVSLLVDTVRLFYAVTSSPAIHPPDDDLPPLCDLYAVANMRHNQHHLSHSPIVSSVSFATCIVSSQLEEDKESILRLVESRMNLLAPNLSALLVSGRPHQRRRLLLCSRPRTSAASFGHRSTDRTTDWGPQCHSGSPEPIHPSNLAPVQCAWNCRLSTVPEVVRKRTRRVLVKR